jgi:hypothetical protein
LVIRIDVGHYLPFYLVRQAQKGAVLRVIFKRNPGLEPGFLDQSERDSEVWERIVPTTQESDKTFADIVYDLSQLSLASRMDSISEVDEIEVFAHYDVSSRQLTRYSRGLNERRYGLDEKIVLTGRLVISYRL